MPIDFNAKAAEFIARVQAANLSLLADADDATVPGALRDILKMFRRSIAV